MVRAAIGYLVDTLDPDRYVWRVVPEDTDSYPHAPWWHDAGGELERTFDHFLLIPRARLVALLARYESEVSSQWLEDLIEHTVTAVKRSDSLGSGGGSDLQYALELLESPGLDPRWRAKLDSHLRRAAVQAIARDRNKWRQYCVTPLTLAPLPTSSVADDIRKTMDEYLDYVVQNQSESGTWDPTWSWGESYPDAWALARREWQGSLTLETLTSLAAYGRVSEVPGEEPGNGQVPRAGRAGECRIR
jgi:hypothetical protein